jgi:hypothetical protein
VERTFTVPLPDGQLLGQVSITTPDDWTIVSVDSVGVIPIGGDGQHTAVWQVIGPSVTFTVTGPSDSTETLPVTIQTLNGTADLVLPLSGSALTQ